MATLQEVKNKADAVLVNLWQELKDRELEYFEKHGKYFQLLSTPTSIVVDGVDSDFTLRNPSDEKWGSDVVMNWASKIPFQIEVHENLGGVIEAGFTGIVTVMWNNRIFQRMKGYGGGITQPWIELIPNN